MFKNTDITGNNMLSKIQVKIIVKRFLVMILGMLKDVIKALPVGVIIGSVLILILNIYEKVSGNKIPRKKKIEIGLFFSYITIIIQLTILFRKIGSINDIYLIPFNMAGGMRYIILMCIANVMAFLPLGIFIPIIWHRIDNFYDVLVIGLCSSLLIEVLQLILQCGVCQTEDVIMNTLGAGAGYLIYKRWKKKVG